MLTTLKYLASNSFQIYAGVSILPQQTASDCVQRVTEALANHANEFIYFPAGDQANKAKRDFYDYCGLPMTVGCVDGTHIPVDSV